MTKITLLADVAIDIERKSGWTINLDKIEYNITVIEKELSIPLIEKFNKKTLSEIFSAFQFICFLIVRSTENKGTDGSMILFDIKDDEDEAFKIFRSFKVEGEEDDLELRSKFMEAFYEIRSNYNEFSERAELVFFSDDVGLE